VEGIAGSISTGDKTEDAYVMLPRGAKAEHREDPKNEDVCDIVVVGFNNAILATQGSHCMGSGANHEYPEFAGIYWKR